MLIYETKELARLLNEFIEMWETARREEDPEFEAPEFLYESRDYIAVLASMVKQPC